MFPLQIDSAVKLDPGFAGNVPTQDCTLAELPAELPADLQFVQPSVEQTPHSYVIPDEFFLLFPNPA